MAEKTMDSVRVTETGKGRRNPFAGLALASNSTTRCTAKESTEPRMSPALSHMTSSAPAAGRSDGSTADGALTKIAVASKPPESEERKTMSSVRASP